MDENIKASIAIVIIFAGTLGTLFTIINLATNPPNISKWFTRSSKPKRGIIIKYLSHSNSDNEHEVIIPTDTPKKLANEIITMGPGNYLIKTIGFLVIFKSIEVIGDDIDLDDAFLIKVSQFMGLDTSNINNKEQLIELIDSHIKYNPDQTINAGYEEARNDFAKRHLNL